MLRVMMANFILEGIYFYSSFMFFYNLSRNGKMPGSAQEIRCGITVLRNAIDGSRLCLRCDDRHGNGSVCSVGKGDDLLRFLLHESYRKHTVGNAAKLCQHILLAGIALLKRCGVGRKDIAYIVPGGTLCIIDKCIH